MGRNVEEESPLLSYATLRPKFPLGLFPKALQPYLELIRLEKPTGTILMFWPFAWGLTMAAFTTNLRLNNYAIELSKCMLGAFILRSSACTINDIFDRKMDAGVERTRNRPMPSGRISVPAASLFLFVQYLIGVIFFYFTVHELAFAIYPLLKRCTHWPQAWLGFAMNFGFITAWISTPGTTVNGPLLASSMTACWCWTMLYDTIYACQDIKDDVKMGVRSTAILFGSWIRPLLVFCGLMFVTMLAIAGYLNGQGLAYFVISVGGTALHLVWQYMTVDLEVPKSCWRNFNRNGQLGWIVWGGLMVDYLNSLCIV
ncbi:UbiA prenyltransferase [Phlegmacium glaucopus]|nr:UbiA prenyltransferase [Phlegmacium glaucopus]